MTFFSESDDYRERSLNIQMSQVNKDKQYYVFCCCFCGPCFISLSCACQLHGDQFSLHFRPVIRHVNHTNIKYINS